ncbi:MAG TPA: RHS repeat-associated core domain-containing protein, partial [Nitrospirota bacterium]|nr:RHS repeat-associated core domain-containing protein [Nitrospirota bacterium]
MFCVEDSVDKGLFLYEPGLPDAMIHNDHLGTPQKMTDASGTVVWAADYKPFGEATVTVSTITNNMRGIGQYFDAETGLIYNYFRDLNPATGKYIESDPLLQRFFFKRRTFFLIPLLSTIPERLQPYSYVASNPVNFIDPLGLYHCVDGANCDFTPDMDRAIRCFDDCTGHDTAITSGRRNGQNNQHGQGTACDAGRNNNPEVS